MEDHGWRDKAFLPLFDHNKIMAAISNDPGAHNIIMDIMNGLNIWLFKVLSGEESTDLKAKSDCLSFGKKIAAHLEGLHHLNKNNMITKRSLREYLEHDGRAAWCGLIFIVKTFRSSFKNNFLDYSAAITALLITTKREEAEFERFRMSCPSTDIREILLNYYNKNRDRLVGGADSNDAVAVGVNTVGSGKSGRMIFRGFNP